MAEGDAPATLTAAVTADGASTRNALRLAPRLFKVQLLDCFTGRPVTDARTARVEVTPKGGAALTGVWPLAGATRWDVEDHYWLKSLPTTDVKRRDGVLLPVLLERGVPLPEEPGFKGAVKAFAAWYAAVRGASLPAAEQNGTLDAAARKALLEEYNRCFYEAARRCSTCTASWPPMRAPRGGRRLARPSSAGRGSSSARAPRRRPGPATPTASRRPSRSPRSDIALTARACCGCLSRCRPCSAASSWCWSSRTTTVVEAPMRPTRGAPLGVATVRWEPVGGSPVNGAPFTREGPGQSMAEGAWGWRLNLQTPQGWVSDQEFRSFQRLDVAGAISCRWPTAPATGPVPPPFSHLYLHADDPEVVLLAQTWCQPTWDEVDDAPDEALTTVDSYVPALEAARPLYRGRHLHIVTRANGLSGSEPDPYDRTIGYGYLDPRTGQGTDVGRYRSGNGHGGVDVHAKVGDPVFAVGPGVATRASQANGAGDYVQLTFDPGGPTHRLSYFHLDAASRVSSNRRVKAGQILGFARRSGNLGAFSANPGHTHLQVTNSGVTGVVATRSTAALVAAMPEGLFPTHGHAHLFPCACECFGGASGVLAAVVDCDFSDANFTRSCWAVSRLVCPHIHSKPARDIFRLQAQLRYLFKNPGRRANAGGWRPPFSDSSDPSSPWDSPRPDVDFVDLGSVDGRAALGKRTQAAIHAFLTIFGLHTGPFNTTTDYVQLMTPTALALLDHLAPVVVPV
ncbi:MAG: M23 family metallopeptidase [Polyangiales bacterium]